MDLARTTGTHAVIPIKDPVNAKQRLGPVLDGPGREMFFRAMVSDMLDALTGTRRLDAVWVVTRDRAVSDAAVARGLNVLREPKNRGQSAAVRFGIDHVREQRARSVVTLPGDLPLVTSDTIDALISLHDQSGSGLSDVTLVTDTAERGTNAIVMSPPGIIDVEFGNDSYAPHSGRVVAAGARLYEYTDPLLGLDIDRPEDLVVLSDYASEHPQWTTRTQRWLSSPVGLDATADARRLIRQG